MKLNSTLLFRFTQLNHIFSVTTHTKSLRLVALHLRAVCCSDLGILIPTFAMNSVIDYLKYLFRVTSLGEVIER